MIDNNIISLIRATANHKIFSQTMLLMVGWKILGFGALTSFERGGPMVRFAISANVGVGHWLEECGPMDLILNKFQNVVLINFD